MTKCHSRLAPRRLAHYAKMTAGDIGDVFARFEGGGDIGDVFVESSGEGDDGNVFDESDGEGDDNIGRVPQRTIGA